MATVNLAPYDAQMAELDRRQRIAQALAAAGAEQQDVPAYKGISAMPSRAGMLATAEVMVTAEATGDGGCRVERITAEPPRHPLM
jgi:hypothetical protein